MDTQLVKEYAEALRNAIGDDVAFEPLFHGLVNDRRVLQQEAIEIVGRLSSPMPKSTTKKAAFERLRRRHESRVAFSKRESLMSGRSAA